MYVDALRMRIASYTRISFPTRPPSRVFIAHGGVPELTSTVVPENDLRDLIERMLQSSGRRVDLSKPSN